MAFSAFSMTGYASHTFELPCREGLVSATIHVKVLNGRFFEPTFRLPHALAHLEPALVKMLREALVRGTVYCTIHIGTLFALTSRPMVSSVAIAGYIEALNEIKKHLPDSPGDLISAANLVGLPHVVEFVEDPVGHEINERILADFSTVVEMLQAERVREGAVLADDIGTRLDRLETAVEQIAERSREVFAAKRQRILENLQQLVAQAGCTEDANEVQLQHAFAQIEKLDVHEELVRLRTHIASARSILGLDSIEKGKRLDFTTQEMFRETNTIGAKCGDAELGGLVISAKVELEKIREQVQNLV
ncbi:MAG: hypothetical protein UV79_C0007G0008 [candidate division TM6 bacterium GW2011_GWF2_43_17]|nr:MAG: hypothetical protein UV79_C0007G0008 [candidate division TM6 bacterium GW2011_GWF2_43_17]HAU30600.1 YicC family protein [Candidatus Dependentiae bacterium]